MTAARFVRPRSLRLAGMIWTGAAVLLLVRGQIQSQAVRDEAFYGRLRTAMVERQIARRGITDPDVLRAMSSVPRHLFVPPAYRSQAYEDYALPIEEGQTITQPYIVALMTQCLAVSKGDKVLEIGTGSGYQAAILAHLTDRVYSIEIHEALSRRAGDLLRSLGLDRVRLRSGDGFFGWPEEAPFDAIIVTCAAEEVPGPLFDQLAEGGRLIIPLGPISTYQVLTLITKKKGRPQARQILDVRFVPMTGESQKIKRPPLSQVETPPPAAGDPDFVPGTELLFQGLCANFPDK